MSRRRRKLVHLTTVDLSLAKLLGYQLRRFAEEGFDVVGASAPGPYKDDLRQAGVRFMPVRHLTRSWSPVADAIAVEELVFLFRRERPDIVHTHNPKSGVLGRAAARIAGVPIIVNTVHGLYLNPSLPAWKRRAVETAERSAMRLSHHEFFQSAEDERLALRERLVPPSRASLLGNGVDISRFDPARVTKKAATAVRRSWGATPSKIVVGTVGRLVREKGLPEFFEAARIVGEHRKGCVFVAVGPEEPSKEDRLTSADLARARRDGVVLPGPAEDMPVVYAGFDVFVLASHREGMPRATIEASAMGKPVVATDIRGCREVVAAGETGELVPPRDPRALAAAIERLAADGELRARLGEAGRARALERFDEEQVVQRELEVYRRLLAARGDRP